MLVNLRAPPYGHPLAYPAVYDLVARLRKITGIAFSPHLFRHTYATWLQIGGVASDATFPGKRERPGPASQLPGPSRRAGRVWQQGADDLRCHHTVASAQTMMHPDLWRLATA